jgi:sphinganine-1-phosphate aldolase
MQHLLTLAPPSDVFLGHLTRLLARLDKSLDGTPPSRILLGSGLAVTVGMQLASWLCETHRWVRRRGALWALFETLKALPVIRGIVAREKAKIIAEMDSDMRNKAASEPPRLVALPTQGMSLKAILAEAENRRSKDMQWTTRSSTMSGAVYMADESHFNLLCSIYSTFAHSNPLHADAFPSVARMEAEVVSMTAEVLGGGGGGNPQVCGLMTSGGTESILTAIRATRDYMRATRGISQPEMIVAVSAHAAVYKAAEYFGILLVRVGVDDKFRMDVAAVRRAVNRNTILIYASAPGYPHGAVDPVEDLAILARRRGVCLHVDACLGGFVLPFAAAGCGEDVNIPPFDFRVAGVTSMSVDTHKYGLAQKGSSVVLYSSSVLRQYQYTAVMDWSGGLYISPSQAGSRSGGLIAQTWAALVHVGRRGYEEIAGTVLSGALKLREGISRISGLEVLGCDVTMVVAWGSSDPKLNIYVINDVMVTKGWHLSVLHSPPALHMCLTSANVESISKLLVDLSKAVDEVRNLQRSSKPSHIDGGKAPIYGLAGGLPDRGLIGDILRDVQDLMLKHV